MKRITILINCNDSKGIIASVTNFIHQQNGNIVYIDQHVDREDDMFFMRLECEFLKASFSLRVFKSVFKEVIGDKFEMTWRLHDSDFKPKMAVFVSKYEHCLYDILSRYSANELEVEIPLIISNHPDLEYIAKSFGNSSDTVATARMFFILEMVSTLFPCLTLIPELMVEKFLRTSLVFVLIFITSLSPIFCNPILRVVVYRDYLMQEIHNG